MTESFAQPLAGTATPIPNDAIATSNGTNDDLETATDPVHLQSLLVSKVPSPGRIKDLSLFCSPEAPERALCLVDLSGVSANAAVDTLGGEAFAYTSVALAVPLLQHFSCHVRKNGSLPEGNCACFVARGNRVSLLDSYL